MKIEAVRVTALSFPLPEPFRAAVRTIPTVDLALVEIACDDGPEGVSYAFGFGRDELAVLASALRLLGDRLIGCDALAVEQRWDELGASLVFLGRAGVALAALGALDIALWDLAAKAAGLPLHRFLGSARDRIPVYGSGGSLALSLPRLVAECAGHRAAGFMATKIKLGLGVDADRARVAAVRSAIGEGMRLIVDANQQFDFPRALEMAEALAPYDPWWLEEPLDARALGEYERLCRSSPVRIGTGESNCTIEEHEALIGRRATDILMPNVQRCGGITPWRRLARAAEAAGIPMATHVLPEVNVQLGCATPVVQVFEHIDWWPSPFREPLDLREGAVHAPAAPGLGVSVDPGFVARYRVH